MHLQRNYYEVLGLPQTATTDEIKKKYRELARKFHPDLVQDKALGQRIFTQINQAYRTLSDSERRSQYDATLMAASRPAVGGRPQANIITGTGAVGSQNNTASRSRADIDKMVRDADMAMISGQAATAKSLCEAALKVEPDNAQALSILGDALATLKQNDEAMRAYRKSLNIQPSSIVEAKLGRLQAMARMASAAPAGAISPKASTNGRVATKPEPSGGRGLIDRILKRK